MAQGPLKGRLMYLFSNIPNRLGMPHNIVQNFSVKRHYFTMINILRYHNCLANVIGIEFADQQHLLPISLVIIGRQL